jgi:Domain of Unknown Function (DUF1080)
MCRFPMICLIVFSVIFACHRASADNPSSTATTQPVAAPSLSGKLGTPIELFNGNDLDGWTWVPRPPKPTTGQATPAAPVPIANPFNVRDGILHDAGKPIGYLRISESYDNYVLTVEQRHVAKGNGGILFAITGPDKVWPHSIEAQGQTGEEGDLRNVADFKLTMDPARTEPKRLRRMGDSEKPIGEWETIQIIVDHGQLSLTVNGVLQNQAAYNPTDGLLAGKIGLQAEGGEMEFRKVELTPIEPAGDAK